MWTNAFSLTHSVTHKIFPKNDDFQKLVRFRRERTRQRPSDTGLCLVGFNVFRSHFNLLSSAAPSAEVFFENSFIVIQMEHLVRNPLSLCF